jgi:cyanamide hydratase
MHIQQFPSWEFTDETWLLACLLHDIGTTDKNIRGTLMSFEFYGGLIALDLLHKQHKAPIEQAESVAEVIIRHQDIGNVGTITTLGLLIQLATIFGEFGHILLIIYQIET